MVPMPLVDVDLALDPIPLPAPIQTLYKEAESQIDHFVESRLDDPIVGFVPSDFPAVYAALYEIVARRLAPGRLFCEWGSGFGIVAMTAASLDFDACGIEIEDELVERARDLADEFELPVEFVRGSFIPEGGEAVADGTTEFAWLRTDAPSGYDELGLDPQDFDVVFAYPWPGEEDTIYALFERYGATGALLVTYQGVEDVRARRKVARNPRPSIR